MRSSLLTEAAGEKHLRDDRNVTFAGTKTKSSPRRSLDAKRVFLRAAKMYQLHMSRYILGLHSNNGKLFCMARKLQNKLRHTNRTLCIKVALDAFTKQRKSMGKQNGASMKISGILSSVKMSRNPNSPFNTLSKVPMEKA